MLEMGSEERRGQEICKAELISGDDGAGLKLLTGEARLRHHDALVNLKSRPSSL